MKSKKEFVTIKCNGVIETHLPSINGCYMTLCGIDGDEHLIIDDCKNEEDKNPYCTQDVVETQHKIDCYYCAETFKLLRKYTAKDFKF